MRITILSIIFILGGLSSCHYNIEEELYPSLGCDTENVTYNTVIFELIRDNCYQCHDAANNFGNITLEGYDNLKKFVDTGQLLGVIKHEPGFSPMPQNRPQLLECEIEKVEEWIKNGAPL